MPRNSSAGFSSTCSPTASCVSATSAFWPTEPKSTLCRNAASCWDLIPPCQRSPRSPLRISCWSSPAWICPDVLLVKRGRWSLWPNFPSSAHGTRHEKLLCLSNNPGIKAATAQGCAFPWLINCLDSFIGIPELVRYDPATIFLLVGSHPYDSPPPLLPLYNIHSQAVKSAPRFSPTRFIPNAA